MILLSFLMLKHYFKELFQIKADTLRHIVIYQFIKSCTFIASCKIKINRLNCHVDIYSTFSDFHKLTLELHPGLSLDLHAAPTNYTIVHTSHVMAMFFQRLCQPFQS